VATFDADGQLDADDLMRFVAKMDEEGSDVVVGIRSYRNRYSEHLLALWARYRFGIQDPLCGLKLYRLSKAKGYFPFDSFRLVGMELVFRMVEAGNKISELPIHVKPRIGQSRYGSSLRGEMNILKSFGRALTVFGVVRNRL